MEYILDEPRVEELRASEAAKEEANAWMLRLFVIRKVLVADDRSRTTLRYYYVLDGVVYEAPTLASVVRARLLRLGWYLKEAFDEAKKVVAPEPGPSRERHNHKRPRHEA